MAYCKDSTIFADSFSFYKINKATCAFIALNLTVISDGIGELSVFLRKSDLCHGKDY